MVAEVGENPCCQKQESIRLSLTRTPISRGAKTTSVRATTTSQPLLVHTVCDTTEEDFAVYDNTEEDSAVCDTTEEDYCV